MSLFSMLKTNAKRSLKGNWGTAALVQLAPFLLGLFTTILAGIFGLNFFPPPEQAGYVLSAEGAVTIVDQVAFIAAMVPMLIGSFVIVFFNFFVTAPITLGITYWFSQLTRGNVEPASKVFHFFESFKRYTRALGFTLQLGVRQLLWGVAFWALPIAGFAAGGYFMISRTVTQQLQAAFFMGMVVFLLIVIGLAILYTVYMNKYFLAVYKLAEDDETTIRDIMKESIEESKGFRFSVFWFQLSFIGWILLMSILFPLFFYVAPYMDASMAMYARYIMETKERERLTTPGEIYPVTHDE